MDRANWKLIYLRALFVNVQMTQVSDKGKWWTFWSFFCIVYFIILLFGVTSTNLTRFQEKFDDKSYLILILNSV